MITTKNHLYECLKADATLYSKQSGNFLKKWKNSLVTQPINAQNKIWCYITNLRYSEYYYNNSLLTPRKSNNIVRIWNTLLLLWHFYRLRCLSYKTGIQIPPNTCGPGLQIWHYGHIIINQATSIGKNLTIYPGVEIGTKYPGGECPIIGDNVFIGAGAKIFGKIKIGNNVTIAANAVVVKDIPDNAIVGGVPAQILKFKNL